MDWHEIMHRASASDWVQILVIPYSFPLGTLWGCLVLTQIPFRLLPWNYSAYTHSTWMMKPNGFSAVAPSGWHLWIGMKYKYNCWMDYDAFLAQTLTALWTCETKLSICSLCGFIYQSDLIHNAHYSSVNRLLVIKGYCWQCWIFFLTRPRKRAKTKDIFLTLSCLPSMLSSQPQSSFIPPERVTGVFKQTLLRGNRGKEWICWGHRFCVLASIYSLRSVYCMKEWLEINHEAETDVHQNGVTCHAVQQGVDFGTVVDDTKTVHNFTVLFWFSINLFLF